MANTINFELVSPTQLVASRPAEMVVLPLTEGDAGILAGHSMLISTLRPGAIDIYSNGKIEQSIFVSGGVCEITDTECSVLSEQPLLLSEVKLSDAELRLTKVKEEYAAANANNRAALEADLKISEALVSACVKRN